MSQPEEGQPPKLCPFNITLACADCKLYTGNIPFIGMMVNFEKKAMCVFVAQTVLLASLPAAIGGARQQFPGGPGLHLGRG